MLLLGNRPAIRARRRYVDVDLNLDLDLGLDVDYSPETRRFKGSCGGMGQRIVSMTETQRTLVNRTLTPPGKHFMSGLAGVALSQITNVGPNLGQSYIVDSFLVVVFGGVGNLWGTLVAGMSLGVINQVLQPWVGAVLAKVIVLIGVILFIQKRPQGLFAPKGRTS